jgi:predicted RNA binding protein YcfA (HicA-like mRNA interferase family)
MKGYGKKVREILEKHGCYFLRRGKGDHDIWHSPINNRSVSVDKKILSRRWANDVLKWAGINEKV